MVDAAARLDHHPAAVELHAPTEIYLLHVSEEVVVEASETVERLGTAAEGGAAGPEYLARGVVLPPVTLHMRKYASAAEWIAEKIDESPRGTGIFERFARVV